MKKASLSEKFALIQEYWRPKVVAQLNGQELKLVKLSGVFPWHHHENEDELFLVWRGEMAIEFRDRRVVLQAGEFCGETGMLGHQAADKRAVALEDTVVALIAPDVVRHLFEASPRLARETGHTLEVHRKALQSARTAGRQR